MGSTANYQADESTMSTALPDGGSVLLNLSSELYFGLNGTGTQVWDLLSAGRSTDEIVEAVCASHPEVDRDAIRSDVVSLLAELEEKELVVRSKSTD